jgi:hypothetical protein
MKEEINGAVSDNVTQDRNYTIGMTRNYTVLPE